MSAGIALPKRVFAHGFLFNRGEKMSKSVGNVVDPFGMAAHYGVDQVRYFFLREVSFGQDGSYSHEAIVNRINADLANDLGNLAQRSLSMIARILRRQDPGAGRADRCGPDDPGRGRCAACDDCRAEMDQQAIDIAISTRSGRWWRTPTAISPARSPGRCARPIRRAWGPCSMSPPRRCARSPSWCSPSCRARRRGCSTCWPCRRTRAASPAWAKPAGWRRAGRCRRPSQYSRAMSSRRSPGEGNG